ncbi:hypothetical protein QTP88_022711 [Uroleucon formosanum]
MLYTKPLVLHDKCVKLHEVLLHLRCNKKSPYDHYQVLNNKGEDGTFLLNGVLHFFIKPFGGPKNNIFVFPHTEWNSGPSKWFNEKMELNGSADMNIIMNETCVQSKKHKSPLLSLIIENSIMVIRTFLLHLRCRNKLTLNVTISFSCGEMQYLIAFSSASKESFIISNRSSNDLMDILKMNPIFSFPHLSASSHPSVDGPQTHSIYHIIETYVYQYKETSLMIDVASEPSTYEALGLLVHPHQAIMQWRFVGKIVGGAHNI